MRSRADAIAGERKVEGEEDTQEKRITHHGEAEWEIPRAKKSNIYEINQLRACDRLKGKDISNERMQQIAKDAIG